MKELIDKTKLPEHVAIIMDGNGRWAKQRNKPRVYGHKNGVKSVRNVVEAGAEIGIKYLTIYAFSTENWKRPRSEVEALMTLLVSTMNSEAKALIDNNIRLTTIGDTESLPRGVLKKVEELKKQSENNTGLTLNIALSYSSKWEIVEAVKKIAIDYKSNQFDIKNLDEKLFDDYLSTASFPNPELLIRTSGEYRISNFLLWQIAYSELYFTNKLWPDFGRDDLFEAILDFQKRERRFGKTSEQLNK
jgi:undecaprenyl diphosphate synthase